MQRAVKIADVSGEMYLNQTGHLLTVIDGENNFEYYLFKADTNEYRHIIVDENGKPSDRNLYPFGQVHFNLHKNTSAKGLIEEEGLSIDCNKVTAGFSGYGIHWDEVEQVFNPTLCKDMRTEMYGKMRKNNIFTNNPFLACVAMRLYDGSFLYASNPVLISPDEVLNDGGMVVYAREGVYSANGMNVDLVGWGESVTIQQSEHINSPFVPIPKCLTGYLSSDSNRDDLYVGGTDNHIYDVTGKDKGVKIPKEDTVDGKTDSLYRSRRVKAEHLPTFCAGLSVDSVATTKPHYRLQGYDLVLSLGEDMLKLMRNNEDVFKGICVFITNPAEYYEYDFSKCTQDDINRQIRGNVRFRTPIFVDMAYMPRKRTHEQIEYDLTHSPFYLLKEYKIRDLNQLLESPFIDLSKPEDDGVLDTLTTRVDTVLTSESVTRTTYLPRVQYNYNGRLHIADYTAIAYHAYPLDLFGLHNHFVEYQKGATTDSYLHNLVYTKDDPLLQYPTHRLPLLTTADQDSDQDITDTLAKATERGDCLAYACVEIETQEGLKRVVRYLSPADWNEHPNFVELNPFLCYPDYRAKTMTIMVYHFGGDGEAYEKYKQTFQLEPHPHLNLAYYLAPNLRPIQLHQCGSINNAMQAYTRGTLEQMLEQDDYLDSLPENPPTESATERFPNGLRVSKTDNPMFFPVENTYQVGSSQVLALCSNAVAVGTGQTGSAPLYVFCTDGIYALFVDSEGKMAYTNARVLARDVLNNKRSVVPTDLGVAFTTDRGLMLIAGEQVQEIGQPLEGDIVPFQDPEGVGYSKIATNAYVLYNLANINPTSLPNEHFLQYLKGAIIAYNHNERELMVSNPNTEYSYVLGAGQWTRRDYSADEYTLCYPTCYRLRDGELYQLDNQTDRENGFFVMTRGLKLESIGFKELHRVVARGTFSTTAPVAERYANYLGLYVFGSYDGYKWACLGHREKAGSFNDIGCLVERTDCRFFRLVLAGQVRASSRLDYFELSSRPSRLNTKIR